MSETELSWPELLSNAIAAARTNGRHHIADYLSLRATNDETRSAGVTALFEALTAVASEMNAAGERISTEIVETHSFRYQNANMIGSRIEFRLGIRCLTVEAGWTRTPSDGFMRGGALAVAKFHHFGMKHANAELLLIRRNESVAWMVANEGTAAGMFAYQQLREHIEVLAG